MADVNYKSLKDLRAFYKKTSDYSGLERINRIKSKLEENGFFQDLNDLPGFLEKNPKFLSYCDLIQQGIDEHNTILVITDSPALIWHLQRFFTILYALNNTKSESIFRISLKDLITDLLDKDTSSILPAKLNKNLVMISDIFAGDNRIASMAPSIEGIINPLIFNRKVVFTAHTIHVLKSQIAEDVMNRLRTFYSPTFEQLFQLKVAPVIIQTDDNKKSVWARLKD